MSHYPLYMVVYDMDIWNGFICGPPHCPALGHDHMTTHSWKNKLEQQACCVLLVSFFQTGAGSDSQTQDHNVDCDWIKNRVTPPPLIQSSVHSDHLIGLECLHDVIL